jgi:thioredoxin reductase
METSQKGIWAAGDCNDGIYKQNGVAIGDGVKAIENIYGYLKA